MEVINDKAFGATKYNLQPSATEGRPLVSQVAPSVICGGVHDVRVEHVIVINQSKHSSSILHQKLALQGSDSLEGGG